MTTARGLELAAKAALVALLAVNAALYVSDGTPGEAADSAAWFMLLLLFYAETTFALERRGPYVAPVLRYLRFAAAAAIVLAAVAYFRSHAWLDAANSVLWIAVVALLEAQVRHPALVERQPGPVKAAALALYGALAIVPLAWMARGEWFAAYDALLWLAAFAFIEADVWPASTRVVSRTSRGMPR